MGHYLEGIQSIVELVKTPSWKWEGN
jgi:hypothetical protein